MSTDLCRETSIILKMEAPLPAADVRNPDRSECPEWVQASKPARPACALTILATDRSVSLLSATVAALLMGRNTGPFEMPAAASHAAKAFTGQATSPRAMRWFGRRLPDRS